MTTILLRRKAVNGQHFMTGSSLRLAPVINTDWNRSHSSPLDRTTKNASKRSIWRNSTITSSKALYPATQPCTHTKIPSTKSKFYIHLRHNFFKHDKVWYVPHFSIYVASCCVESWVKISQTATMSASKLHKALENAVSFFTVNLIFIVQSYSVQSLVGKRELFGPKKSSEEISVVCVALLAILPFLMTSPHTQFWLSPGVVIGKLVVVVAVVVVFIVVVIVVIVVVAVAVVVIIEWFSKRTGTSVDDGRARGIVWTRLYFDFRCLCRRSRNKFRTAFCWFSRPEHNGEDFRNLSSCKGENIS